MMNRIFFCALFVDIASIITFQEQSCKKKTENLRIHCESLQAFPGNGKQGVRKEKNMVRYRAARKWFREKIENSVNRWRKIICEIC